MRIRIGEGGGGEKEDREDNKSMKQMWNGGSEREEKQG